MFARSLSCLCLVHAILPNALVASLEGVSFKTAQGRQLLRGDINAQLSGTQDIGDEQQRRHARSLQTEEEEEEEGKGESPSTGFGEFLLAFFVGTTVILFSPCIIFLAIVILAGVIGGSIFLCITCCKRKRQGETAPVRSNNWYWGV